MLAKFSVKKPFTVLVGVVLVIILGIIAFTGMTPELLPNINLPYVVVVTTYNGATPEQVETIVTKPVEQSMATLDNVKSLNSTSGENYSMLMLEFNDSVDMNTVTVDIREKLDLISGFWDENVGTPFILKINPNMLPVAVAAVSVEGKSEAELTAWLKDNVMSPLEGVEGIASISTEGMIEESVSVVLQQGKIDEVNERVRNAVDGNFSEAEAQIAASRAQLQNGISEAESNLGQIQNAKNTLTSSQGELASQLGEAKAQLNQKQIELIEGKMAIVKTQEELTTKLEEMEKTLVQLKKIQGEIFKLENAREQMITAVLEEHPEMSEQEAVEYLRGNNPQFVLLEGSLSLIDQTLSALGTSREALNATIGELEQGIIQIKNALEGLSGTLHQLESGQITLTDAMKQVETQSLSAGFQVSSGMTQVIVGESMLKATVSQLEGGMKEIEGAAKELEAAKKEAEIQSDMTDKITMESVSGFLMAENFSMPAGYVTENDQKYLIRVGDKITDPGAIQNLLLFDLGMEGLEPIYLRDVADIFVKNNGAETYAKINGQDGVVLSFSKQSNYPTATVSENIQKKFDALSEENEGLKFTKLMDQGDEIYTVVNSVLQNLILGAVLAVAILILFLKDIRPTFIIACSIPISVTFALVLMYFSGVTLNIISLAGLATGVGMLVDNSIVVIENIYRLRSRGVSAVQAAVSGTVQVAGAITASTLTTICVFFPIVFVTGLTRDLFSDMALTIGYSLLASLLVALTLIPAMATGVLRNIKEKPQKFQGKIFEIYDKVIKQALSHKLIVMGGTVGLLILSVVLVLAKGFSYMPDMESQDIMINLTMPEAYKLEQSAKVTDEVSKRLLTMEEVETVGGLKAGSTESMMGVSTGASDGPQNKMSVYVSLKDNAQFIGSEFQNKVDELCKDIPDCEIVVSSGMGGVEGSSGGGVLGGSGVAINLYGDDLEVLRQTADDVGVKMREVKGTKDVETGTEESDPEIRITVDKQKAMENGLTVAQVFAELNKALTKEKNATSITYEGSNFDVMAVSGKAEKMTPYDIRNYVLQVTGPDGSKKDVRLDSIAVFSETKTLSSINRSEQRRMITVTSGIEDGYNISLVTGDVEKHFSGYALPKGVTMEFSGENETIMKALFDLVKMLLLGVLFVYLIMVAQFQSLRSPFVVMFTIPLAFTGGLIALLICNMDISVISMVGFVMLVGIIVNNGIVLVDCINQLRIEKMDRREAIIEASKIRLRPILMTALTTILGLLPMGIGLGMGASMMQPVAVTCIGGLIYATIMTLVVVPVMYELISPKEVHHVREDELKMLDL